MRNVTGNKSKIDGREGAKARLARSHVFANRIEAAAFATAFSPAFHQLFKKEEEFLNHLASSQNVGFGAFDNRAGFAHFKADLHAAVS